MSTGATQSTRPLAIATPLGDDVLLLNSISGSEALSTPFQYELELQSETDDIDPVDIVGHNVTMRIEAGTGTTRFVNGFISDFTHIGWADRFTSYRARVVPWLWFLDQTADCRIFQNKSTPEIIQQIFKDLGFTDFKMALGGSYPPHEYCVQYRETDLNFVSRLLEEEGIFYFFKHENGKHTLTLADAVSSYFDNPDSDVEFPDPTHGDVGTNRVTHWERNYSFRPGKYTHTDYNFKSPSMSLAKSEATKVKFRNMKAFEVYDYHGRHEDTGRGATLAKVRLQELEARHDVATGQSTCGSFTPGGKFTFSYHRSQSEIGKTYVLTNVDLQARLYNYTPGDNGGFIFENRFRCIPAATLFRPERRARKPVVEGPQTAVIVGPSGEEIYVDEFSRVKVQFHWDREGKRDENSSCWMRVSQAHAGNGWGYIDIPRIGEEVIVDFIEGDPDKPIITGRVYNGEVMPPFPLDGGNNAKSKTRRGNTTKTYKGGGFNEMSMDDTPGKEQIRVHGQYNMDTVIENDETHTVHNNRTRQVDVDEGVTVGNNQTLTVNNDRTKSIVNNETTTVGVDRMESVGNNENISIANDRAVAIGNNDSTQIGNSDDTLVAVNQSLAVGANRTISVAANQSTSVGANLSNNVGAAQSDSVGTFRSASVGLVDSANSGLITEISAGLIMSLSAGVSLTLSGPGGTITIGPSGIHIKGTTVIIEGNPVHINP